VTGSSLSNTESGERITNWQLGRIRPTPSHVPHRWELVRLTEVARLESGHTPSRRRPEYWDGDIPWISLHDSAALDEPEISTTAHTIGPLGLANSSARLLPEGTVVFSRTATIGKATIMAREMSTSQDFANYVCGDRVHNRFLMHLFRFLAPEWTRLMAGSTHNTIYMPVFLGLEVLLPTYEEQCSIADALSDVDALIAKLDELIAKKRDLKQAVMQQLLTGKTRLPGFHGPWIDTSLGEIGESIIGLTYSPSNVVPHGLLVLRSSNVQRGRITLGDNVYVNVSVPERLITKPGDILVCVRNGSRSLIGKCALIDEAAAGHTFGAFMTVYRTKYSGFVFYALQSEHIQRQIQDNLGATINQITIKDMRALALRLPPDDEQSAIAAILSEIDTERGALETRRDKIRLLKQGMMQELLTGRTRLR